MDSGGGGGVRFKYNPCAACLNVVTVCSALHCLHCDIPLLAKKQVSAPVCF